MGALRDHGQHDVHDHDAAHQHEDADDADGHGGDGRGELFPEVDDGVGGEEAEVIVLAGPQVAVGTQQHAHLVFGLGQLLLRARFGDDADAVAIAVRFEVALDGDHREIVQRVAKDAAQGFGRAHHFVRVAFDLDELADGVAPFKEAGAQIVAQEDHRGMAANFFVGNAAADIDLHIVDGGDILRDALHVYAESAVAPGGDARVPRRHHADVFEQGGALLDELIFVRPELRIALLHLHELFGVKRAEPRHADHAEAVGTHVGDLLRDIQIHAVDQGGDGDQCGGGQNDAEQR